MLIKLTSIIGAYLLGSIPTGYLVGRIINGKNIYKLGSGNPGTANALVVLGKLPGILVFVFDIAKGLMAMALVYLCGGREVWLWWGGASAVIGHIYPVTMGFRGGKGLATGFAIVSVLMPITIPIFLLLWFFVFMPTRSVPLASSVGMLGVLLCLAFQGIWPGILGSTIILWRHWPESIKFLRGKLTRCKT
jgi:glycerol-3-phosphate acyltransferase PlsY